MCNISFYIRATLRGSNIPALEGGLLAFSGVDRVDRIGSVEMALTLDLHFQAVGTNLMALSCIGMVS